MWMIKSAITQANIQRVRFHDTYTHSEQCTDLDKPQDGERGLNSCRDHHSHDANDAKEVDYKLLGWLL